MREGRRARARVRHCSYIVGESARVRCGSHTRSTYMNSLELSRCESDYKGAMSETQWTPPHTHTSIHPPHIQKPISDGLGTVPQQKPTHPRDPHPPTHPSIHPPDHPPTHPTYTIPFFDGMGTVPQQNHTHPRDTHAPIHPPTPHPQTQF